MEKIHTTKIYILNSQMQSHKTFLDDQVKEELLHDSHLSDEKQLDLSQLPEQRQAENEQPLDWSVVTDLLKEQKDQQSIQKSPQHTLRQNEDSIKKEDLEAITQHWMDANWLYENLKRWIEEAVVQWPKGEILPDWKARANLINAFMKATGRFKSDNVINVLNLFGKVNTENNNDIY